jgi:hypothetical protein
MGEWQAQALDMPLDLGMPPATADGGIEPRPEPRDLDEVHASGAPGGLDEIALEFHLPWVDGGHQERGIDTVKCHLERARVGQIADDRFDPGSYEWGRLIRAADQRSHGYTVAGKLP